MKTWYITGSNRGLGLELARAVLEAGDRVAAAARKPMQITKQLAGYGGRLLPVELDVTNQHSVQEAAKQVFAEFGHIDVLVNNAGYGQLGVFEQISEADIARQFETNVFGTFGVTRSVLPVMRAQRSGIILTISSIGGLIGFDGSSIYCSTKFALEGWSESLNLELEVFGIKAVLVEPGFFRTDFLDSSSVAYSDIEIPDYHHYSQARKKQLDSMNHLQPGDPVKFGQALLKLVNSKSLPVRFAAGSDAFKVVVGRNQSHQAEADQWHDLTVSTDIDSKK